MRVAWIVYGSLAQRTGGYVYDNLVVEGLRAGGDLVDVVELPPPRGLVSLLRGARAARRLSRADVIVGDELCFREIAASFAIVRNAPRVLLVHHLTSWEPRTKGSRSIRRLERAALSLSDVVVATSNETAARLEGEGLVGRDAHLQVVEPGADRLPSRVRRTFDPGRTHALFVGTLAPRKRVVELVAAFRHTAGPGDRLRLVGSTTRDPAYAARVRATVAGDHRIAIDGEVGDERLADLLADADALVLPSALEGYGIVLAEARWAGVPLLATRTGAATRLVRHEIDGLLFTEESTTAALARFLGDPTLRAALRRGAEDRPAGMRRWSAVAGEMHFELARATSARR